MLSSTRSQNFFAEHDQAPPENLDSFRHFDFTPTEKLPFKSLKELGHGGQAYVDKVEYISLGRTCVRKRWRISEAPQAKERARTRFFSEVAILKKLHEECHVIRLLATYCQGTELGLLHLPLGQCDLNVLLRKPTQERRGLILDDDLERGFGCLSAALQYIHQERIRHRDIKPDNILVHGASLVFTDFGISRDFSELSSSLTDGYVEGTHNYYAPEVAAGRPRGCSADVFSLGCVLLEIWSVLFGLAPEDQHSFPSLKPYYRNLAEVQAWIEEKKSSENSPLRAFWLQACQLMVAQAPSKRPRMSNVLLRLREEYERQPSVFSTMCCRVCLEKHIVQSTEGKHDELRNTDFTWSPGVGTLLDQDHPTSLFPNSNQDSINGKSLMGLSLSFCFMIRH
jgi:serine/threonine protein kinase